MYRPRKCRSSAPGARVFLSRPRARPSALAVLLLGLLAAAGCGRKTAPRPPEMVAPQVITDLRVGNTEKGIVLRWGRPTDYADGSRMLDLAGFEIQRATPGGAFEPVANLVVTDRDRFRQIRSFRHLDSAVSEGERYRYRVVSFTTDEYFSQPSPVVEIVCHLAGNGSE